MCTSTANNNHNNNNSVSGECILSPDGKLILSVASPSPSTVETTSTAPSSVFSSPASSMRAPPTQKQSRTAHSGGYAIHPLRLPPLLNTPNSPSTAQSPALDFARLAQEVCQRSAAAMHFSPHHSPYRPTTTTTLYEALQSASSTAQTNAADTTLTRRLQNSMLQPLQQPRGFTPFSGETTIHSEASSARAPSGMSLLQSQRFVEGGCEMQSASPLLAPIPPHSGMTAAASSNLSSPNSIRLADALSPLCRFLAPNSDGVLPSASYLLQHTNPSPSLIDIPSLSGTVDSMAWISSPDGAADLLNAHGGQSAQLPTPVPARIANCSKPQLVVSPILHRPTAVVSPRRSGESNFIPSSDDAERQGIATLYAKRHGRVLSPSAAGGCCDAAAFNGLADQSFRQLDAAASNSPRRSPLLATRVNTAYHLAHSAQNTSPVTEGTALTTAGNNASSAVHTALQQRILKTKLCVHHLHGRCARGSSCTFAHSTQELRRPPNLYKTRLCINFANTGSCPKGPQCRFAHGGSELRTSTDGATAGGEEGVLAHGCYSADENPDGHMILEGVRQQGAVSFGSPTVDRFGSCRIDGSRLRGSATGLSTPTAYQVQDSPPNESSSVHHDSHAGSADQLVGPHDLPVLLSSTVANQKSASVAEFASPEAAAVDAFLKVPLKSRARLFRTLSAALSAADSSLVVPDGVRVVSQDVAKVPGASDVQHPPSQETELGGRTGFSGGDESNFGDRLGLEGTTATGSASSPFLREMSLSWPRPSHCTFLDSALPDGGAGHGAASANLVVERCPMQTFAVAENIPTSNDEGSGEDFSGYCALGTAIEKYVKSQREPIDGKQGDEKRHLLNTWQSHSSSRHAMQSSSGQPKHQRSGAVSQFCSNEFLTSTSLQASTDRTAGNSRADSVNPWVLLPHRSHPVSGDEQMNNNGSSSLSNRLTCDHHALSPHRYLSDSISASACHSSGGRPSVRLLSPSTNSTTATALDSMNLIPADNFLDLAELDAHLQNDLGSSVLGDDPITSYKEFLNATNSTLPLTPEKTGSESSCFRVNVDTFLEPSLLSDTASSRMVDILSDDRSALRAAMATKGIENGFLAPAVNAITSPPTFSSKTCEYFRCQPQAEVAAQKGLSEPQLQPRPPNANRTGQWAHQQLDAQLPTLQPLATNSTVGSPVSAGYDTVLHDYNNNNKKIHSRSSTLKSESEFYPSHRTEDWAQVACQAAGLTLTDDGCDTGFNFLLQALGEIRQSP